MTTCQCQKLPPIVDIGMGEHDSALDTLEREVTHGEPLWWLSVNRCRVCGQRWLVAADERINDVFLLRRLNEAEVVSLRKQGEWPSDFSKFAEVLRLGRERGHSAVFADAESPALVDTVIVLAREEDGVPISTIASLLQIGMPQAQRLADLAQERASVRIARP